MRNHCSELPVVSSAQSSLGKCYSFRRTQKNVAAWIPQSFDEACKRNAGRRRLHMRKREARAGRIQRLLNAMDFANLTDLRDRTYGFVTIAAREMEVSKATASRDFALVRRIHRQFGRMFGRSFDPKQDQVVWNWNCSHYGFVTPESMSAGYGKKAVGYFPFDTRKQETEDSYGGLTQLSWYNEHLISRLSTRDLIRFLTWSHLRLPTRI
jgi:hypothetical protein